MGRWYGPLVYGVDPEADPGTGDTRPHGLPADLAGMLRDPNWQALLAAEACGAVVVELPTGGDVEKEAA